VALPEVEEDAERFAFSVRGKGFVWVWLERIEPKQPRVARPDVIAVRVANAQQKEWMLSSDQLKFFTEPHYNGFPAVLIRLAAIGLEELRQIVTDGWRCQAPRALTKEFDREK